FVSRRGYWSGLVAPLRDVQPARDGREGERCRDGKPDAWSRRSPPGPTTGWCVALRDRRLDVLCQHAPAVLTFGQMRRDRSAVGSIQRVVDIRRQKIQV